MIQGLFRLLATSRPEPAQQAERIVSVQLNVVLPAKVGVVGVVLYYAYVSDWFYVGPSTHNVLLELLQWYLPIYLLSNVLVAALFVFWRRFPPGLFQWLVFTLGLLDGMFVAGLAFITDGFDSIAYWIFPALIVLNALSIPLATPQIVLNLLLGVFYLSAGILNVKYPPPEFSTLPPHAFRQNVIISSPSTNAVPPAPTAQTNHISRNNRAPELAFTSGSGEDLVLEPQVPRFLLLWLLTACCYGVQVLAERQRRVIEESREFALREGQLQSAGRLAAEFAHQIKNPLAIINNTVFSMQRALKDGRHDIGQQLEIIREEVERSDKIVTEILGYARLSEGRVEKLDLIQELDRAIQQVFPAGANYDVHVERSYESDYFPPLLMQRGHLSEIFVNILQNARDAMHAKGAVRVKAVCRPDYSVEVRICDTGPGIPPEKVERIFEAYYSTKEKGTGLGLAIVKHNVELYGGTVRVQSELGKGACFILTFPARTVISFRK